MANDYTWQELFRRLGLEARPQVGYYYKPQPHPFLNDVHLMLKNRPLVDANDLKDIGKASYPNRSFLINTQGGFSEQSPYIQSLLSSRKPLAKNIQTPGGVVDLIQKLGLANEMKGTIEEGLTTHNPEIHTIPSKFIGKPTKLAFPNQTLKMMGNKIGSAPLTKGLARAYVIGAPVAMMVEDTMRENEWREYNKFRRLRDMVGDIMLRDNSNLQWRQGE